MAADLIQVDSQIRMRDEADGISRYGIPIQHFQVFINRGLPRRERAQPQEDRARHDGSQAVQRRSQTDRDLCGALACQRNRARLA